MTDYAKAKAELSRMAEACRANCHHLKIIDRQVLAAAERLTIRDRPKDRQYGRHATTWTPADERYYRHCVDSLYQERRPEIVALRRKIDRQRQAITQRRRQLGLNEPSQSFVVTTISEQEVP